jgi:hypothetical protein
VLDGLRRLPVYNQKSQLAVEEAQRLAKAMIA